MTKIELHEEICERLTATYEKKNHDYGESFAKVRAEFPNAVLIRIADKFERLKQLMQGTEPLVAESISDTLEDLANYCIMEVIERELEIMKKAEQIDKDSDKPEENDCIVTPF